MRKLTDLIIERLSTTPYCNGIDYLLGEGVSQECKPMRVAILGTFDDKVDKKLFSFLQLNNIHVKIYTSIDDFLKTKHNNFDRIMIGTITRFAHFKKALLEIGVPENKICQPKEFNQLAANFFSDDNSLPHGLNEINDKIKWLNEHEQPISAAYDIIEPQSRQLYLDKLTTYLRPECINIFIEFIKKHSAAYHRLGPVPLNGDRPAYGVENFLYFFNDLIKFSERVVYVDIGAHVGDSLTYFLRRCSSLGVEYSSIYCFEPDSLSFQVLANQSSGSKGISLFNAAITPASGEFRFHSTGFGGGKLVEGGDNIGLVRGGPLLEFVGPEKVHLIKWDTPGKGTTMEVLSGCGSVIARDLPSLVIGAYHNVTDIFMLPIKIRELSKNYKIYLSHNSWLYTETDYYCIPPTN